MDEEQMQELLESEIQIILQMDHPNIVRLYQCCYDNTYINIVMELVKGEPLSDYLIKMKRIPEKECKIILYHVMCAIKYFHLRKIVHRDLKLDNIMLMGQDDVNSKKELRVKLIDFGMSKLTFGSKKINLNTYCGTIDFISPEVLEGKTYNEMTDNWSCGVIAYFMLSGMPPFAGRTDKEIERNIITCNYHFESPVW
jgi:serine/threonine protein kinase